MVKRRALWLVFAFTVLSMAVLMIVFVALFMTGMLTPTKTHIVLVSGSAERAYNGRPLTAQNWYISEDGGMLEEGHRISVTVSGTLTESGSTPNTMTAVIFDERGNDVTDDYEIEYRTGTLTVSPIKITVRSGDANKLYDGEPLTHNSADIMSGGILANHIKHFEYTGTITDIGKTENTFVCKITNLLGEDVTHNYEITYIYGTLEVMKVPTIN